MANMKHCFGFLLMSYCYLISFGLQEPVPSGRSTQFRVNCSDSQTRCIKTRNLTEFPKDIPQNITAVELKNGNITTLKKESLTGLTSLKTLILSNNNINTISPGVFHDQSKLNYLDLCGNNMTAINGKVWVGLVSLETLQLAGNKFHSLPTNAFSNLPELKILRISFAFVMQEKEKLFDHNTFPNSKKQPQIHLEEDDNFLVCNSSNCWLKELEEKGLLVHYQKNGRPSRPMCSDKPGLYWDEADLKCPADKAKHKTEENILQFIVGLLVSLAVFTSCAVIIDCIRVRWWPKNDDDSVPQGDQFQLPNEIPPPIIVYDVKI